jgi:dipeptidyl aminopeptidase/acylaminoacyl peptidase
MKTNIVRDDFLKNQILTNLKVNEKQNVAAFFINKANLNTNSYEKSFWIINLEDNSIKNLKVEKNIVDYTWEEDYIEYFVIENNSSTFYKHDIYKDYSEKLFNIPMKVGKFILYKDKVFFYSKNSTIARTIGAEEGTELPFYAEGAGVSSNYRKTIYCYNTLDKKFSQITDVDIDVAGMVANKDAKKIVFISSASDRYIKNELNMYLLDTDTEKYEMLTRKDAYCISKIAFLDEETIIFAGSDLKAYGRNQNQILYTIDINTKECKLLHENFTKSTLGTCITCDARFGQTADFYVYENNLYFLTVEEGGAYLNKTNKFKEYEKLSFEYGTVDCFVVLKEAIIFVGLRGQALQEIYCLKDGKEKQLTNINDWLAKERIVVKPEPLSLTNNEEIKINGFVIKPVDFDQNKKYPAVLCIHGGPKMLYTSTYSHLMQLLASNGYFVFFCNPRGSDGKGDEFLDIRSSFGQYAYEDLMSFTEAVLNKYPAIDRDALGVTGGSYGGYMTNYIITHTTIFSAAVSERGISNMLSMFNTSDIGYLYIKNYMSNTNPWDNIEGFLKESPIMYANKVKTPTLFVHGKDDGRCNYTESLQMYSALKYFGIETKLCLFENETHLWETKGKPLNKIKRFDELLGWFNVHLKDKNI